MKAFSEGKVNEAVLKRSVLKEISQVTAKKASKPCVGQDASMEGVGDNLVINTFYRALNNIYVKKVKPYGIMVSLLLSKDAREGELKQINRLLQTLCQKEQIVIMGGETMASAQSEKHVLTIQAFGVSEDSHPYEKGSVKTGDIVMASYAGMAATSLLTVRHEEELSKRFSRNFLEGGILLSENLSIKPIMDVVSEESFAYAHDVSEGGIFAALWELGEFLNCGMNVDLQAIKLRQETIEVCEFFDINPYVLFSLGSVVFIAENGAALVKTLEDAGIPAAVIGTINDGNCRMIENGEESRYLEPFKGDDIYKIN